MAVNVMAATKINMMFPLSWLTLLCVGGQTASVYWTCSTNSVATMTMSWNVAESVSANCSNILMRPVLR